MLRSAQVKPEHGADISRQLAHEVRAQNEEGWGECSAEDSPGYWHEWAGGAEAAVEGLDLAGLENRLLSSSYLPGPNDPRHARMLAGARELFEAYARDGRVTFAYETHVHVGRL